MREQWLEFLSTRATRFLQAVGDVELHANTTLSEVAFKTFLEKLAVVDRRLLGATYFLLQPYVLNFFEHELPRLLRTLASGLIRKPEISGRGIRGKMDWGETLVLQAGHRLTSGEYVVRIAERTADIPENRLLHFVLLQFGKSLQSIASLVGTEAMLPQMRTLHEEVQHSLRSTYLYNVSPTTSLTPSMRNAAQRNRNRIYAHALKIYDEFQRVLELERWELLFVLLRSNWLSPAQDDELFELYCLALCVDVLEQEITLGHPEGFGLIRRGRKTVVAFSTQTTETLVYFDQSPVEALGSRSVYSQLCSNYSGLRVTARRPDICIAQNSNGSARRVLLIEAKKSEDDRYMRDSIYKLFGYLHDFQAAWPESAQKPKAILIFPSGVQLRASAQTNDFDLAIVSGDEREPLAAAMLRAFQ